MTNIVRFVFENKKTGNKYEVVDTNYRGQYWRRLDSRFVKKIDYEDFEIILAKFRNDSNYEEV